MSRQDFRVTTGKGFRLADHDPAYIGKLDKAQGEKRLQNARDRMRELQEILYAENEWAILVIVQAMDAAGKDSTIEHVLSGLNPAGCQVFSFKAPSAEELDHDFMWRTTRCLPERGRIGVFNRSYYEEVLIVRVHPEILAAQKLPPELVTKRIWTQRYEDINAFEHHLARNGYLVLKFFLNVSKKEQKRRFLARLDEPEKNWKFSLADVKERKYWDDYMQAYEDMIAATSTRSAPWHVVPADNKWFTRLTVAATIVTALGGLGLHYPKVDKVKRKELEAARKALV